MTKTDQQRIEDQRREFDAVAELIKSYHGLAPIVDDDYPETRSRYEGAVNRLLRAFADNGRTVPRAPATVDEILKIASPMRANMTVTLCGSLRFKEHWPSWNMRLTMLGYVVFSVAGKTEDENAKPHLDAIHFLKIERSDAIFVIDVDNYIGESTRREIEYAQRLNKQIFYASKWTS